MRRLLLFLIGFAAPPGLIAVQQPDSVTLGKLQTRLAGRTRVRVMVDTGRIEMRGPTLDTEGVRDGSDPTSPIVPWTAIARLQVRSSSFWTGAGFGWGAGFFVGMVAGMSSDDAAKCERYGIFAGACRRGGVDQTVVGVVGGALAGALLGGLIAAPFGRWSTVYQAPSRLTMPAITLRPTTSGGIVVVARIALQRRPPRCGDPFGFPIVRLSLTASSVVKDRRILLSEMRVPERLRRLWWWASRVARRAPSPVAPSVPRRLHTTHSSPLPLAPASASQGSIQERSDVRGRIVVGGDVEVRMWTVGRMVILATGPEEAERALLTLVSHAEPELRTEAGRLAEALRGERAAAA